MRLLFGMILGALLTVAVVYVADSTAPSDAVTGPRRIVNWDVANERFNAFVAYARGEWARLSR
jgi:hypothetical protein